ncbi:MAG: DUF3987 domain-containing protein [Mesorhizobium sp.]|nr:MAG: DUF3987 domain-containing protein [Mesorhizobium sp.]
MMNTEPKSELQPDRVAMRRHLEHLFGGYLDGAQDGLVEIAWTGPGGEIAHARLFGTDELDDATEFAAAVNVGDGCSVYVGMALRKPTTRRNWRAGENDFLAATTVWADFDEDDAVHAAAQKCRATLMPTFAISTGRHPHQRIQLFWRLSETIAETGDLRRILTAMARTLDGDPKVADPARVMRLAGSIAWPHKQGRIAEMTGILNLRDPGPPQYLPDEIRKAFPPGASVFDFDEERARRQDDAPDYSARGWEKAWDGRESEMTRWVWAVVVDWYRESPIPPSPRTSDAKCAESWAAFKETITTKDPDKTLDEEGRGEALFRYKWKRAMRLWDTKVAEAAAQERPGPAIDDDGVAEIRTSLQSDAEPLDFLGAFSVPQLPEKVLPLAIEHHARTHARLMGCDPAAIAMSCLVAAAAAIPDTIRLRMKRHDPSWHESARLWAALVGPPSRKKTPAMNRALEQVNKINARLVARYQSEMRDYEALPKEERRAALRPKKIRLRISDVSIEAVQDILKDTHTGLLLVRDELSGWLGGMDAYANTGKAGGKDRAFWLEAYNGGFMSIDRIGRDTGGGVPNVSVSIIGGIQPDLIREFSSKAQEDGLLARLSTIIVAPATAELDEPLPASFGDSFNRLIERLYALPGDNPLDQDGHLTLVFDDEAQAIRNEAAERYRLLMEVESFSNKLANHLGKYAGLFGRMCVAFHCVNNSSSGPLPTVISADTARRVDAFISSYLLPHAFVFHFDILRGTEGEGQLEAMAEYILARKLEYIRPSDYQRASYKMRAMDRADFLRVMERLESAGWVTEVSAAQKYGKPRWKVNPLVYERFAGHVANAVARREKNVRMRDEITRKIREQQK